MIFIVMGFSLVAGIFIGVIGMRVSLNGQIGKGPQQFAADFLEVDLDLDEVVVQVRR